jgi:hypothetical protein
MAETEPELHRELGPLSTFAEAPQNLRVARERRWFLSVPEHAGRHSSALGRRGSQSKVGADGSGRPPRLCSHRRREGLGSGPWPGRPGREIGGANVVSLGDPADTLAADAELGSNGAQAGPLRGSNARDECLIAVSEAPTSSVHFSQPLPIPQRRPAYDRMCQTDRSARYGNPTSRPRAGGRPDQLLDSPRVDEHPWRWAPGAAIQIGACAGRGRGYDPDTSAGLVRALLIARRIARRPAGGL